MGSHEKMSLPINFLDKLSLPSHTSTEKNSHIHSSTHNLLTYQMSFVKSQTQTL